MAAINQYQLSGVGADVQFGKAGGRIVYDGGWELTTSDGTTLETGLVKSTTTGDVGNTIVSKDYLEDQIAQFVQGLDVKNSVRVATTADIAGGAYNNTASAAGAGQITSAPTTVDGVTLANGDSVLVKNGVAGSNIANGIYEVISSGTWDRRVDADNTPGNEVSGGMFTFTEEGTVNADSGWLLNNITGNATLGTDNLLFTQFSGAGSITGGDGIAVSGSVVSLDGDGATIRGNGGTGDKAAVFGGTAGNVLRSIGASSDATWGNLDLSNFATVGTTILPQANGGTGTDTAGFATNSLMVDSGTGVVELAIGTANEFLRVNAGGNALEYTTAALDDLSDVVITSPLSTNILQFNGTNWVNVANSSVGGLAYGAITGDSGTSAAATSSDTLILSGATNGGIVTVASDAADTVTFAMDVFDLTTQAGTVAAGDFVAMSDSDNANAMVKATWTKIMQDLDIVNGITANGFTVRTAADTYASRTITVTAQGAAGGGLEIANGDGIAGNPEIGIDWTGMATLNGATVDENADFVLIEDISTGFTKKILVADMLTGGINAWGSVTDGSNTANADNTADTLTVGASTAAGLQGLSVVVSVSGGTQEIITYGLDITNLGATTTVDGTDEFVVFDGANNTKATVNKLLDDMDVVHGISSNGITVRTAADTYTARTLTASAAAQEEGAVITNGDGVAGNPTVGVDITNLTANGADMVAGDLFIIDNGSNNVSMTGQEIADGVATLIDFDATQIIAADTFTSVGTEAGDNNGTASTVVVSAEQLDTTSSAKIANFFAADTAQNTPGSQFNFTQAQGGTDEVRIEATNTAGTGDVDIRLVPQDGGQVFIGEAGPGAIQSDDDELLLVKGGDSASAAAGDLILEGGDGTAAFDNGDVLLRGGAGGTGADGKVCIQFAEGVSTSTNIMCFEGVASAVNSFTTTNSATGTGPEIAAVGSDTNVDINLAPKGTGLIVAPAGYTVNLASGGTEALVTKGYVDAAIAGNTDELMFQTSMGAAGGSIGTMAAVAGKEYHITRVTVSVTSAGADSVGNPFVVSSTVADPVSFDDIDVTTTGRYVVDVYDDANHTGAALTYAASTGLAGNIFVEYKAVTPTA